MFALLQYNPYLYSFLYPYLYPTEESATKTPISKAPNATAPVANQSIKTELTPIDMRMNILSLLDEAIDRYPDRIKFLSKNFTQNIDMSDMLNEEADSMIHHLIRLAARGNGEMAPQEIHGNQGIFSGNEGKFPQTDIARFIVDFNQYIFDSIYVIINLIISDPLLTSMNSTTQRLKSHLHSHVAYLQSIVDHAIRIFIQYSSLTPSSIPQTPTLQRTPILKAPNYSPPTNIPIISELIKQANQVYDMVKIGYNIATLTLPYFISSIPEIMAQVSFLSPSTFPVIPSISGLSNLVTLMSALVSMMYEFNQIEWPPTMANLTSDNTKGGTINVDVEGVIDTIINFPLPDSIKDHAIATGTVISSWYHNDQFTQSIIDKGIKALSVELRRVIASRRNEAKDWNVIESEYDCDSQDEEDIWYESDDFIIACSGAGVGFVILIIIASIFCCYCHSEADDFDIEDDISLDTSVYQNNLGPPEAKSECFSVRL